MAKKTVKRAKKKKTSKRPRTRGKTLRQEQREKPARAVRRRGVEASADLAGAHANEIDDETLPSDVEQQMETRLPEMAAGSDADEGDAS